MIFGKKEKELLDELESSEIALNNMRQTLTKTLEENIELRGKLQKICPHVRKNTDESGEKLRCVYCGMIMTKNKD